MVVLAWLYAGAGTADDWPTPEWEFGSGSTLRISGRAHLDVLEVANDGGLIDDGMEVRRARIGISGKLGDRWGYKAQIDFSGGDVQATDVYVSHPPSGLIIGQSKVGMSLEQMESSNDLGIIERGLPAALVTGRRTGLFWSPSLPEQWHGQLSAYQGTIDEPDASSGLAARLTWSSVAPDAVWHVGASTARESAGNRNLDASRFRARPEIHLGPPLVDTGRLSDVDHVTKLGLEVAFQSGPWSARAEWVGAQPDSGQFDGDLLHGSYIQAGRFWTDGVTRKYRNGKFGAPTGFSGQGTWETVVRYSYLDLDGGSIAGGRLEDWTLGANYYFGSHARIMFGLVHARSDTIAPSPLAATMRWQMTF